MNLEWYCMKSSRIGGDINPVNILKGFENIILTARSKHDLDLNLSSQASAAFSGRSSACLKINKTNGKVFLLPFKSIIDSEMIIEVTDECGIDWNDFVNNYLDLADDTITLIDVFMQMCYRWDELINYCYEFNLRYRLKEWHKKEFHNRMIDHWTDINYKIYDDCCFVIEQLEREYKEHFGEVPEIDIFED